MSNIGPSGPPILGIVDNIGFNNMASFFNSAFLLAGGKLVYLYKKKLGSVPKCGDCKVKLHGVSHSSKLQSFKIFLCKINFYI